MSEGPGQGAYDPRLSFAFLQFDAAGIEVTNDGKSVLASLFYAGEKRDKEVAGASINEFVSRIITVAREQGITVLDGGTVRRIAAQIDWWPFGGG